MARFYDTHAHLDYPDFASDLPEVIQRAQVAGIERINCIGTDFDSSRRALELAERFDAVYAVVGWHPSDALRAPEDIRSTLRDLASHPKVVALGETGLDYYRLPSRQAGKTAADDARYKERQAELFDQHLEVAAELGLNCVIHQRESLEDTIARLEPFADRVRGVFHCFSSDTASMQRILEMNSIVSFTGMATFKNAQSVRDVIAAAPEGKFMLETDCPFLAPVPYRGKRCEPAYVKEIAETVALTRRCSLEELSRMTCGAADVFFRRTTVANR